MVVTKLSSSATSAPDQKMGYNPLTGHFRILQKNWLEQIKAELGISQPTAFNLLRDATSHGLVFVDTTGGQRKTVLSWYLPKLLDDMQEASLSQNPKRGELLRGPLGFWRDWEEFDQLLSSQNVMLIDEGCDDPMLENKSLSVNFLEVYRRCKREIEQKGFGNVMDYLALIVIPEAIVCELGHGLF